MKTILTLFVIVASTALQTNAQFYTYYVFKDGKQPQASSTKFGVYNTSENVLNFTPEIADNIQEQFDGILIKTGKEKNKNTFEELATQQWGYLVYQIGVKRFVPAMDGSPATALTLGCIGEICLYGGVQLGTPIKNSKGGFGYTYVYSEDGRAMVSKGLSGDLINLTPENFAELLEDFNPTLKSDYLSELANTKAKSTDNCTKTKNSFDLFVKYFEKVNNSDYK